MLNNQRVNKTSLARLPPQDSRWPLALQLLSVSAVSAGSVAMYNAALAAVEDWTQAVQLMMEMQRGGRWITIWLCLTVRHGKSLAHKWRFLAGKIIYKWVISEGLKTRGYIWWSWFGFDRMGLLMGLFRKKKLSDGIINEINYLGIFRVRDEIIS